jgi:hypothetical protein
VSASNLERRDHDSQLQHLSLRFEAMIDLWTTIIRHRPKCVQ